MDHAKITLFVERPNSRKFEKSRAKGWEINKSEIFFSFLMVVVRAKD